MADLNHWKIWLLAIRPKTLPASSAPVLVATALALGDGVFQPGPALACLAAALMLQIASNLANDVFDYQKGTDSEKRTGPLRVTQAGLLTPKQVLGGMSAILLLTAAIGLYLVMVGGWPILLIGVLSIISAVIYTGGPFPIGYHGLGELFVFIFFGPTAVCGTYYTQSLQLTPQIWAASIPVGFLIMAILVVNNLRDLQTDAATGKRTLAVRLGKPATQKEYILFLTVAFAVPLALVLFCQSSPWLLITFLAIPLAASLIKDIYTKEGRDLNQTLAKTANLGLLFSLLYALGYLAGNIKA